MRAVAPAQFAQCAGEQLDLADHRDAAVPGFTHQRFVRRDAGRQREQFDAVEQAVVEGAATQFRLGHFVNQQREPRRRRAAVGHAQRRALTCAPARHGQPGFTEAEHEDVFSVKTHQRSFKVDRPNSTSISVMIQKRTTTCVSFHPPSS